MPPTSLFLLFPSYFFPQLKPYFSSMAATQSLTFPGVHCLSSSTTTNTLRAYGPTCPFQRSNFFKPNSLHNSTLKPSRLSVSHKIGIVPTHVLRVPILCCLADNHVESVPSESPPTSATEDLKEATIDLKLPRRSLLLHFTCNACGERSKKLINRVAYERGTVFVQCAGCQQHHKLIDNLGLVVEYDFREESGMDSNADQVLTSEMHEDHRFILDSFPENLPISDNV